MLQKIVISRTKIKKDDFSEIVKLIYSINPKKFQEAFSKVGIFIDSEDDLKMIVEARNKNLDIAGKVKNNMGLSVVYNGEWVVNSILIDDADLINNIEFVS